MINIVKLVDTDLILATMMHKDVWKHISEQEAGFNFCMQDGEVDYYGIFNQENSYFGLFRIDKISSLVCEIHTCLLPNARGAVSKECFKPMMEKMKSLGFSSFITRVPSNNRLAIAYAKRAGMVEVGKISNAWNSYDGIVDIIILERGL